VAICAILFFETTVPSLVEYVPFISDQSMIYYINLFLK